MSDAESRSILDAIPLGLALAIGAVLVLAYFASEIVTSPPRDPATVSASAAASEPSAAAEVDDPAGEGFGLMSQAGDRPAAAVEAELLFREALRRDPFDAGAVFGLGWAAQTGDDLDEAESLYRVADALVRRQGPASPIEYYIHNNLGWLYRSLEQPVAAEIEMALAASLTADPSAAGVGEEQIQELRRLYDLGRLAIQNQSEMSDEARRELIEAIALWRSGRLDVARARLIRTLLH